METRKLGSSDLRMTPVGYGAWAIGGSGWEFAWGAQDEGEAIGAIHRSLELGVNWIDTAAVYGLGRSEQLVARALRQWRGPRPYVFTKCVLRWDEKGSVSKVFNADSIRRECEDSLRRLQTDVIDLYQVHWPPEDNGPASKKSGKPWRNSKNRARFAGSACRILMCLRSSARKKLRRSHHCSRHTHWYAVKLSRKYSRIASSKGLA